MKRLLSLFFPVDTLEIHTSLSKERILQKLENAADAESARYFMCRLEDGFCFAQKARRSIGFGYVCNSFAPVSKGRIEEKDGRCTVSVRIRLSWPTFVFSILFCSALAVAFLVGIIGAILSAMNGAPAEAGEALALLFPLPVFLTVQQIAFRRPAKRMRELFEDVLVFD